MHLRGFSLPLLPAARDGLLRRNYIKSHTTGVEVAAKRFTVVTLGLQKKKKSGIIWIDTFVLSYLLDDANCGREA